MRIALVYTLVESENDILILITILRSNTTTRCKFLWIYSPGGLKMSMLGQGALTSMNKNKIH